MAGAETRGELGRGAWGKAITETMRGSSEEAPPAEQGIRHKAQHIDERSGASLVTACDYVKRFSGDATLASASVPSVSVRLSELF